MDHYIKAVAAFVDDDDDAVVAAYVARRAQAHDSKTAVEACVEKLPEKKKLNECLAAYNMAVEALKTDAASEFAKLLADNQKKSETLRAEIVSINAAIDYISKMQPQKADKLQQLLNKLK